MKEKHVYVLAKSGKPLMPTKNCAKVRILLKEKRAKVVRREPFTIQLLYDTTEFVQPVTLGVDPGYMFIGLSASTADEELYASETEIRTDIKSKMYTRRSYRKDRRSRKVRHRKVRFNNRKSSKPKGWLPPTITQKIQSHVNEIGFVTSILPVSEIVIESSPFDIAKIINPDISGEDYQNGPLKGWAGHVREYVLYRDGHICQNCFGASGCKILHTHHLEPRPKGTDRPENQTTLCEVCHLGYHSGKIKLNIEPPKKFYVPETAMNIMRHKLVEDVRERFGLPVKTVFGADTKSSRIEKGYEKTHAIDALIISGNIDAEPAGEVFRRVKKRAHNRQIFRARFLKGGKRRRAQTDYEMFGFRLFDRVLYDGREVFVTARRKSGYFKVAALDGSFCKDSVSYKKLKLLERAKRTLTVTERRSREDILKVETA